MEWTNEIPGYILTLLTVAWLAADRLFCFRASLSSPSSLLTSEELAVNSSEKGGKRKWKKSVYNDNLDKVSKEMCVFFLQPFSQFTNKPYGIKNGYLLNTILQKFYRETWIKFVNAVLHFPFLFLNFQWPSAISVCLFLCIATYKNCNNSTAHQYKLLPGHLYTKAIC